MKKKGLVTIAALATLSTSAFAAEGNVQLYGVIDAGVTHFTGIAPAAGAAPGQTVSSTGLSSGVQTADRIGLKGSEDLGGGTSVVFNVETGFCGTGVSQAEPVSGAKQQTFCTGGGFMQRKALVGVVGGFGKLMAGRTFTTLFLNEAAIDPFGWGLTGDIGNLSVVGAFTNNLLLRSSQMLAYTTPNLSGFKATATYSFAPGSGGTVPSASGADSQVPRSWSLGGNFKRGPAMLGFDYLRLSNDTALINPSSRVNDGTLSTWQLFGAYDFGVVRLSGIYEQAKQDYSSGTDKFWLLGATVPVGPGAILLSYDENKDDVVPTSGANALPAGTAKQYAIGYTYSLSKQTNLYATYAHLSNAGANAGQAGTAYAVHDSTDSFSGVNGQASTGFGIGIRHKF